MSKPFVHSLLLNQWARVGLLEHMIHDREVVGSIPTVAMRVVPLSKALYLNYSSQPRCYMGTGIIQCWEGNRLAVEEVWRSPHSESGPIAK